MSEPSIRAAVLADPSLPFDRDALRLALRDQRRWSRTYLYPVLRPLSRLLVTLIVVAKRLVPVRLSAHATMDRLCVWFLRRWVSPEAGTLLIRHFVVETNLLGFLARNAGVAGVDLRPTSLADLGDRAVIRHDLNVYETLIRLAAAPRPIGRVADPDFSGLDVPALDCEPGTRRLARLDIQTALCLMNIPFALCLTPGEYRRAVHSLRLDASLLSLLATVTGDPVFLSWRPAGSVIRVDSTLDVPRAVYEHAVICEHAHARLLELAARAAGSATVGAAGPPA